MHHSTHFSVNDAFTGECKLGIGIQNGGVIDTHSRGGKVGHIDVTAAIQHVGIDTQTGQTGQFHRELVHGLSWITVARVLKVRQDPRLGIERHAIDGDTVQPHIQQTEPVVATDGESHAAAEAKD